MCSYVLLVQYNTGTSTVQLIDMIGSLGQMWGVVLNQDSTLYTPHVEQD